MMEQRAEGERFLGEIQPGDHIFSKRMANFYQHHGIYMGDSMVIHLRRKSSRYNYCDKCRYIPALRCDRILSCLDCFRDNQMCFIIRYRIPLLWENLTKEILCRLSTGKAIQGYSSKQVYLELFLDKELYCHAKISRKASYQFELEDRYKLSRFSTSKSADEVMKTALEDGSGFKRYSLLMNNCEDFAIYCKTNKVVSTQVEKWFGRIAPIGIGRICYKAAKCVHRFCIRRDIQSKLHERLESYSSTELDQPEETQEAVALLTLES